MKIARVDSWSHDSRAEQEIGRKIFDFLEKSGYRIESLELIARPSTTPANAGIMEYFVKSKSETLKEFNERIDREERENIQAVEAIK